MESDIEVSIRKNIPWNRLSANLKQVLGNSQREYEKLILEYSVKNQLRYKGNLVRHVKKSEADYYDMVLTYSKDHLMLFPYHLSDIVVRELRLTPFQYYIQMVKQLISQEKSYDSLPNFTAADCYRLLKVGRNEYIEIMNNCRSVKKSKFLALTAVTGRKQSVVSPGLPTEPVNVKIQPWWIVQVGNVQEEDVRIISPTEKRVVDRLIDEGGIGVGMLNANVVRNLYRLGYIYFDVPIDDTDSFSVPPLNGFVMNRVTGDFLEKILYKIFVSIDEHMTVEELANILQIDIQSVKNALSVFCRLDITVKTSLKNEATSPPWSAVEPDPFGIDIDDDDELAMKSPSTDMKELLGEFSDPATPCKSESGELVETESGRIAFLFDSTLTAFLMMGNMSSGLKAHAVTLFEAGKLGEEKLNDFLVELENMCKSLQSEIRQTFTFAEVLTATLKCFRRHRDLDMVRCESLMGLETGARSRILKKNYKIIISMAPLSGEASPLACSSPPIIGPPIAEVNSPWFNLFLCEVAQNGPRSILLAKGTRLKRLPEQLKTCTNILVSSWQHDPAIVGSDNCLFQLNETLQNSPVFLQEFCSEEGFSASAVRIPFPDTAVEADLEKGIDYEAVESGPLNKHPVVQRLYKSLNINSSCGYLTFLRKNSPKNGTSAVPKGEINSTSSRRTTSTMDDNADMTRDPRKMLTSLSCTAEVRYADWILIDCVFGICLFDKQLNGDLLALLESVDFLSQARLDKLQSTNRVLSLRLLDFIKRFSDTALPYNRSSVETSVLCPSQCLLFDGAERVREWT